MCSTLSVVIPKSVTFIASNAFEKVPEVSAADVFSYGLILYEIVEGKPVGDIKAELCSGSASFLLKQFVT